MEFEKENKRNQHIVESLRSVLTKDENLKKNMEIEIRLGKIKDKITQKRLSLKIPHLCMIDRSDMLYFEANIEECDFDNIQSYIKNTKEFETVETKLIKDILLKGQRQSEVIKINGEPVSQKPIIIQKKKLKTVDIFCPGNKYDLRIGISEEIIQQNIFVEQTKGYLSIREKDRTTYKYKSFVVDATKVSSGREHGKYQNITYEIEIEANTKEYKQEKFITIINNTIDIVERALRL